MVDFTKFNRIAIVFPSNSCAYGGLATIGGGGYPDLPSLSSIAWFPVESFQTPSTYLGILAHEGGHDLGLNHANSEDYGAAPLGAPGNDGVNTEYGDPFSVMGGSEYGSSGAILAQYSSQHKASILSWLGNADFQQVTAAGNYEVLPLEGTSGVRGLRILRDPNTQSWLWVESRQPVGQIDSQLSQLSSNVLTGMLVHYENPDLDPLHTYLLDFNPKSAPNNFLASALTPGQSWADPYSLLHLTANAVSATVSTIGVSYDTPCATLTVSGNIIPPAGAMGSIQVTAPSSCAWTAGVPDSWVTLGSTSGQGNGAVSFTVGANPNTTERDTIVTVQRQSVPVIQEGQGITGIRLPSSRAGAAPMRSRFSSPTRSGRRHRIYRRSDRPFALRLDHRQLLLLDESARRVYLPDERRRDEFHRPRFSWLARDINFEQHLHGQRAGEYGGDDGRPGEGYRQHQVRLFDQRPTGRIWLRL